MKHDVLSQQHLQSKKKKKKPDKLWKGKYLMKY